MLIPAYLLSAVFLATGIGSAAAEADKHTILILGGGVAGVIAARTFHENGIDDFVIIDAQNDLGGRMQPREFGGHVIELGPNWIQGTQTGSGPANPIFELAKKHGLKSQFNDWFGSITTYDASGFHDYLDTFNDAVDNYTTLTVGAGERVATRQVDTTARTGYALVGAKRKDPQAMASEYYQFDWEYAQTPEESSWIASSWGNNFTYDSDQGGFSDDNLMSIDPRGFKTIIKQEADEFLTVDQLMLNSTVKDISYSNSGVTVTLTNGTAIRGDYALCTFSVGVLQNDDVVFNPVLPAYKQEAIQSMAMATYTKIFLQFSHKFWFDTEMAIYADPQRGRYPVWQSLDHANFFPGSGILFVTITGDESKRVEALSDAKVKAEVMETLALMFPNITVPTPTDFFFPRWNSNPLFRGSYSNWPPSFFNGHLDNLRVNVDRLYFAGEALSQKYYGFLHGAYFEGLNIAQTMSGCIKNNTCSQLQHINEVTNSQPYEIQNL